jgi:hypothetical protein
MTSELRIAPSVAAEQMYANACAGTSKLIITPTIMKAPDAMISWAGTCVVLTTLTACGANPSAARR